MKQNIRQLISELSDNVYVDNMGPKGEFAYLDANVVYDSLISQIADDLIYKIKSNDDKYLNHNITNSDNRKYIVCSSELANEFGLDEIDVCINSGFDENYMMLESNHILYFYDDYILIIDIYKCQERDETSIRRLIITELNNFIRDLNWIHQGTYDKHLNEWKRNSSLKNFIKHVSDDPIINDECPF